MRIEPLGDRAALIRFGNEADAAAFARAASSAGWPWRQDVVPAYSTVGVFFEGIGFDEVCRALESLPWNIGSAEPGRLHRIPVCYEMQQDMEAVCEAKGISAERVIALHTGVDFMVYAVGFVPGFPYLGYLPDELSGVPRLASPRLRVPAGSVAITGRQTGIYPSESPGGWNLIGRTPRTIVDVADDFFPIRVGDRVRFERIDGAEFQRRQGERL